jgi:NAD(P)-dependent dehydrogenase (short-subunit alcohol dehydrogenase family)
LANQIQNEPIDILMNNAGIWGPQNQSFGFTDPVAWLEVFKVNTIAPQLLAEAFIHNIAKSQLKIIANMVSSMGSITLNTFGGFPIYRSTKAALSAITKSMAIDLKDKNITVIALHPGWVKTDMGGPNAKITAEESVKGLKSILSQLSIKDSGTFIGYNGDELAW